MTDDEKVVEYYIKDDVLFKDVPIYGHKNIFQTTDVITKEAFIACYEKWIKADMRGDTDDSN